LTKDEVRRMAVNFAKPLVVHSGGGAPKSATPPNFNGPKQIAMVVRQFASAIRRQKFRAEVLRELFVLILGGVSGKRPAGWRRNFAKLPELLRRSDVC
jgi:hypothetical protein